MEKSILKTLPPHEWLIIALLIAILTLLSFATFLNKNEMPWLEERKQELHEDLMTAWHQTRNMGLVAGARLEIHRVRGMGSLMCVPEYNVEISCQINRMPSDVKLKILR